MTPRPLGRIRDAATPRAIELYPFEAPTPAKVEHTLKLPAWLRTHDQGREGSCVGHSVALERAIANTLELHRRGAYRRYDPIRLWRAAKGIDEFPGTRPEDEKGTSVRAAYEITRTIGLYPVRAMRTIGGVPQAIGERELDASAGVDRYEWATTVDGIRAAIAAGVAVSIGVQWMTGFDDPLHKGRERWLPLPTSWGRVRGGHSPLLAGASDRREAFRLVNSWGPSYPLAWMPYATMAELLRRDGEAALVVDRIGT